MTIASIWMAGALGGHAAAQDPHAPEAALDEPGGRTEQENTIVSSDRTEPWRVLVVDHPTGLAAALRMELAPTGVAVVELEAASRNDVVETGATPLQARLRELAGQAGADAAVWVRGFDGDRRIRVVWWARGASEAALPGTQTSPRTLALLATSLLEEARSADPLRPRAERLASPRSSRPEAPERDHADGDDSGDDRGDDCDGEGEVDGHEATRPPLGAASTYLSASTGVGLSPSTGGAFVGSITRIAGGVDFEPGLRIGLSGILAVGELSVHRWVPGRPPIDEQHSNPSSLAMGGAEMGYARVWGPIFFEVGFDVHAGYVEAYGLEGDALVHGGGFGFGGGGFLGLGVLLGDGIVLFARTEMEAFSQAERGQRSIISGALGLEWR